MVLLHTENSKNDRVITMYVAHWHSVKLRYCYICRYAVVIILSIV